MAKKEQKTMTSLEKETINSDEEQNTLTSHDKTTVKSIGKKTILSRVTITSVTAATTEEDNGSGKIKLA